jgi:hypothetical protein
VLNKFPEQLSQSTQSNLLSVRCGCNSQAGHGVFAGYYNDWFSYGFPYIHGQRHQDDRSWEFIEDK